jgi:hypothetical protein
MRKLLLLAMVTVCAALAADISGNWEFSVDSDAGSGSPSFTFRQDGEKLTGTYSGALGEAKLAGTVKGDAIEFSFEPSGANGVVRYKGKIESATKMKGELDLGDMGKGTWTATKR